MTEERALRAALRDLPPGGLRYLPSTGSSNDIALAWAAQGAPDLSLVVADEQTAGRGRGDHAWFTPPGSALAISLILRPSAAEAGNMARFSGLAALALAETLQDCPLPVRIKWPNDLLVGDRKAAGVLVETVWAGDQAESVVIGIGVNIRPGSVPPPDRLAFPATCLDQACGRPLDRWALLRQLLERLLDWRPRLGMPGFLRAWEQQLAYRGETVQVWSGSSAPQTGTLVGLAEDGGLLLQPADGPLVTLRFGEVHLRPLGV